MLQNEAQHAQRKLPAAVYPMRRWAGSIGLAVAVGIAYFLAARLSLALLTQPGGVAVFWPASGVVAGALIALGPWARLPVAVGGNGGTMMWIVEPSSLLDLMVHDALRPRMRRPSMMKPPP
jgi:integral membrane sensor domain MASE1